MVKSKLRYIKNGLIQELGDPILLFVISFHSLPLSIPYSTNYSLNIISSHLLLSPIFLQFIFHLFFQPVITKWLSFLSILIKLNERRNNDEQQFWCRRFSFCYFVYPIMFDICFLNVLYTSAALLLPLYLRSFLFLHIAHFALLNFPILLVHFFFILFSISAFVFGLNMSFGCCLILMKFRVVFWSLLYQTRHTHYQQICVCVRDACKQKE